MENDEPRSGFANSLNRPAGPGRYWDELDKFWNGLDQESETAGDCEYARAGLSRRVFERERKVPRAIWNRTMKETLVLTGEIYGGVTQSRCLGRVVLNTNDS